MADYYMLSKFEVLDKEEVGFSPSTAPDGSRRYCIALTGPDKRGRIQNSGWIALNESAANSLYRCLTLFLEEPNQ